MDGPDPRLFQLLQRAVEKLACGAVDRIAAAGALDLGAQAQLELACRQLSEGHGDHVRELGLTRDERRDDAADERRRLAGTGSRLDDQRRVEIATNAIARRLIRE